MATAPELVPVSGAWSEPYVVRERAQETADTWTLTLESLGGGEACGRARTVRDGLRVRRRRGPDLGQRRRRPARTVVLTVRSVGAVTRGVCASGPGAILGVRGPFGAGWPIAVAAGADVVVVAGGIGLAPLPARPPAALERKATTARSSSSTARTPADLLYRAELERWTEAAAVDVTVDAADTAWQGRWASCRGWFRAPASTQRRPLRSCAAPR